jgi:hypothetical protein
MKEAVCDLIWDLVFNLDEGGSKWQDRKINGLLFKPHSVVRQFITESIGI